MQERDKMKLAAAEQWWLHQAELLMGSIKYKVVESNDPTPAKEGDGPQKSAE